MTIKTNNVPRDLLYWFDLTDKERKEFDHDEREDSCYFRFKGWVYCMDNFLCLHNTVHCPWGQRELPGWDGYAGDGSGLILKYAKDECGHQDPERIVIGVAKDS